MTRTPSSLLAWLREPFDAKAWERFVALFTPLIYAWGRRGALQENDAADLAQEVFIRLIEILPTFSCDAHRRFRRWLRTVTLNTWRDRRKRRSDRPFLGDEAALAAIAAPDRLEAFWDVEHSQQLVNRALALRQADLQASTWTAFWAQVVAGRLAKAVAAELGIGPGAAYAAKFPVLQRLREESA